MTKNLFNNHYRTDTARAQWHEYNDGAYFITICTANREPYFGSIIDDEMVFTDIGRYAHACVGNMETIHEDIQIPMFQVMPDHVHIIVHVFDPSLIDGGVDVVNLVDLQRLQCTRPLSRNDSDTRFVVGFQNDNDVRSVVHDFVDDDVRSVVHDFVDDDVRSVVHDFVDDDVRSVVEPSYYGGSTPPGLPYALPYSSTQNPVPSSTHMQDVAKRCGRLSHVISRYKCAVTKYANTQKIPFLWQSRFYDRIIRNRFEWIFMARYIKNNVANWNKNKGIFPPAIPTTRVSNGDAPAL